MNCKPGDLAVITSGSNSGHVVEVLSFAEIWRGSALWNVRAVTAITLFVNGDASRPEGLSHDGLARDEHLRPISGVPVDDEVTDETKVPA